MDTAKEIIKVNFGVMSPEKVEALSAYEVVSYKLTVSDPTGTLYDPRAGVINAGEDCPTCNKRSRDCPGHPGFIRLPRPVLNPLFKGYVVKFLNLICHQCYKPVISEEVFDLIVAQNIPPEKILDEVVKIAQKAKCCIDCESSLGNYTLSSSGGINMSTGVSKARETIKVGVERILEILEHITDDYVRLCGMNPSLFHPRSLILQNVQVIGLKARPPVYRAGQKCDDQLTSIYAALLRAIAQETAPASEKKRATKTTIETAIDDLFGISKSTGNQQLMGIPPRLKGKKGTIRGNAVGKRANFTGRTVTGPDPYIRTNEVMIPPELWQTLTKPVRVFSANLQECQRLVDAGEVTCVTRDGKCKKLSIIMNRKGTRVYTGDTIVNSRGEECTVRSTDPTRYIQAGERLYRNGQEVTNIIPSQSCDFSLRIGDVIERYINNGDYIITNRQPSLHRGSMKAMKMRRAVGSTIRVQLTACASFNMDHDGDEANVHVPQGIQADAEIQELMAESRNIVSDKSSSVINTPIQEGVLGLWLLSTENPSIPKAEFFRLCMRLVETDIFGRFSEIMDVMDESDLYTARGLISMIFPVDFYYEQGDVSLFCGVLLEGALTKKIIKGICHAIYDRYSATEYLRVVDNMQFIANEYLVTRGITVHLGDLVPRHTKAVETAITTVLFEVDSLQDSLYDPVIAETRRLNLLNNARDAGMVATKGALTTENNIIKITESGAKGAKFNVAQIHAGLGQQMLTEGIVKPTLNKNTRVLPHQPLNPSMRMKYECAGFVESSFARGLSPREMLFHAQVGRKDISSTCIGTQDTGYMQRRMVKRGEDARVASNGMVLGHEKAVIQPVYGQDNGDNQELIRVKGVLTFCDVASLVETLNNEYEFTE